jgi:SAM-dependent methyltransferase
MKAMAVKENLLKKAIIEIFRREPKGKLLDFGAAAGAYSLELYHAGYDVTGADVTDEFKYRDKIHFVRLTGEGPLPFEDNFFDYVLLAEVVEHLKDPYGLMTELVRILKKGGKLVLSTPNILNLRSRFRFLFEGAFDYFREPPLDHVGHYTKTGMSISQVHVMPWRYHELEFLLDECGFAVADIKTSVYEWGGMAFLVPIIRLQSEAKAKRSLKKCGVDYRRINKVLLSRELLYGRHLIVVAEKQ